MVGITLLGCLSSLPVSGKPTSVFGQQNAQNDKSGAVEPVIAAFERRVKEYVKQREQLEEKLPKLSKDATPEQIQAHETAFQEAVRMARSGAKPSEIFTPEIARYIRLAIKREFKGKQLKELRETSLEAEKQGVTVKVNAPYPQNKEQMEVPTLLLVLPPLPKQLRYRFVGRYLLLVDRENRLIIDYMREALP